jgi:uncharacterized membrane protein
MTTFQEYPAPPSVIPALSPLRRAWAWLRNPVVVFLLLSTLFGAAALVVNPPMRGPDEMAHFARIYGIAGGEIVPTTRDAEGRKGTYLPPRVHNDYEFFESVRYNVGKPGFTYHDVLEYRRKAAPRPTDGPPVFVLLEGAESYSPFSYLPYLPAAVGARVLDLDFLQTFYLLRVAGFIATTLAAAYAIALTPHLKWAFLMIAMLPAAVYGRAVLSADGAAVSFTLVVAALSLRTILTPERRIGEQALWMTLSVGAKLSNVAFIVLEAMRGDPRDLPRRWRAIALIVGPGIALSLWWVAMSGGDVGTWRVIAGTETPAEKFDLTAKLWFMAANPLHFFAAMISTLDNWPDLARGLVGVLGWGDTPLQDWVYPAIGMLLVGTFFARLELDRPARLRAGIVAAVGVLGYFVLVFLIFYLTWTPIGEEKVWGVQGRYFVMMLPLVAITVAAFFNRAPRETTTATMAVAGAILSGCAMLEALWRVHW